MSILINGIELPKHDDQYVIFTVYGDGGVVYGPLNRPHVRYKNRAVPVPPHGRLIDADALCNRLEKAGKIKPYLESGLNLAISFALTAPTIIPAEPCNNLLKPCKEDEP